MDTQQQWTVASIPIWLLTGLVCLTILSHPINLYANVVNDAYMYSDDFTDVTGLSLSTSSGINVNDGNIVAESRQAVAVSECIRLLQPEGGVFQRWSFAELELASGAGGSLAIQSCDGQTLITVTDLIEGQNLIALSEELPAAIRLQWMSSEVGAALDAWNVYGQSEGMTSVTVLPPDEPKAGDTVTFTLHVSSSGAITRNPILRFSLDGINGLHTPDVDDGLAEDAENNYGSGVAPYKPLEFVAASAGPNGEPPQTPANGATGGEILWHLEDLSDGFSDDLTVVLRIPKGYIHGKTLAARASLEYGTQRETLSNQMTLTSTSPVVPVNAVYAHEQKRWTPYSRVGVGATNIYDFYAIWNTAAVDHPNASDIEQVTLTITDAPEGACTPRYRAVDIRNAYAYHLVSSPDVGEPITREDPLIVRFDRVNFHNETAGVLVYYDVPVSCPGGSQIGTQSTLAGNLPSWQDQDSLLHDTPEPGDSDCRTGDNITIRTASGLLNADYDGWPAWDEYYIKDGSVKAGEFVLTESPRGTEAYRTEVSTLTHSYALFTIPNGVTFHGVRNHEWLSRLYKDGSGLALVPNADTGFNHDDPSQSGWKPVDITWNGEPFTDAPNDLNPRAIIMPGARLLAVKDNDHPAWVGPDYGNWRPYFLWRICDGSYGCDEPTDGEAIDLIGGTIYSYSGNDVARECDSYSGWLVYKEAKSWPKVYTWAEEEQTPSGQMAHIVMAPENQNKASQYVDGRWGINLFDVKELIDLEGISGEVLTEGLQIPEPNQNMAGQSCNIADISFHLPDATACQQAVNPDDPDCLAWWDIPAACQPPNGWGYPISGTRNHDGYIPIYRLRLNVPIRTTTPAGTVLNFVAEVRTSDLIRRGADNAVDATRWPVEHFQAATQVTVLEVPGVDADHVGPVSRKSGDIATYTLQLTNSGNAPNNGIYGVIALPRQNLNGSEFTPDYRQFYVDRPQEDIVVEYSTDRNCLGSPLDGEWTTIPLEMTTRSGYLTQTINMLPAEAYCVRLRCHPNATAVFEPGDHITGAVDIVIPDDDALIGKRLYSRALTGAAVALGSGTEVTPVETVPVRTLVDSGVVLALEKTAQVDPTRAGYVQWSLTVKNVSGSVATQVLVTDDLPPELHYVELAMPLPNGIQAFTLPVSETSGGRLECTIAELAPDDGTPGSGADEIVLSFWTQVAAGLEAGREINNCATAAPANGQAGTGCASISTANLEVNKTQHAVDQNDETAMTDVLRGDIFTYTITAINQFEQAVFMMVHDALDSYVEYLNGTLKVNDATVSDAFIEDGLLEYHHAELLNPGETLTLSFDVQVKDVAPHAWMIKNIAVVTPYLNPLDPSSYLIAVQTNHTLARVAVPETSIVPEPSMLILISAGLLGLAGLKRRLRKK